MTSTPIRRWSEQSFQPGQARTAKGNESNGLFWVNSKVRFRDVVDGLSNTIMVGERSVIGRAGIWIGVRSNYHESDTVSDGSFQSPLNRSTTGFSSRHRKGVNVLLGDGSVRRLSPQIDSKPSGEHVYS